MNVAGILGSLIYTYHAQELWRVSPEILPRAPHSQPRRRVKSAANGVPSICCVPPAVGPWLQRAGDCTAIERCVGE